MATADEDADADAVAAAAADDVEGPEEDDDDDAAPASPPPPPPPAVGDSMRSRCPRLWKLRRRRGRERVRVWEVGGGERWGGWVRLVGFAVWLLARARRKWNGTERNGAVRLRRKMTAPGLRRLRSICLFRERFSTHAERVAHD